jgi:hypothetical protein
VFLKWSFLQLNCRYFHTKFSKVYCGSKSFAWSSRLLCNLWNFPNSFPKLFIGPLILAKKLEYKTHCITKDHEQKDQYSEYFCIVVHIDHLWKGFSCLVMNFLSTLIFIYLDPYLSHSITFQCFIVVTFFLGIFFLQIHKMGHRLPMFGRFD